MVISNTSFCPQCGSNLKYYDKVLRIVKSKGGTKRKIKISRFQCVKCNKIHRYIPAFIFPYKHYSAQIIRDVINGIITSTTLGFEDYPCEATMSRWSRK